LRLVRFFKQLYLLVFGYIQAMRTLSWVFVLLTLIIYIFAILVKQLIPIEEMAKDPDFHAEFRFGSVARCMWTLFELVTLEGWTDLADPLVKRSPTWAIFFIIFIMGLHYGLLNLVVAIIVESTMETAKGQEETMRKLEDRERRTNIKALQKIYEGIDSDGDGLLNLEEFRSGLQMTEVREQMKKMSLPPNDVGWLFEVLDISGDGVISIDEFINGCLKLTGIAKSKDLFEVHRECTNLAQEFRKFQRFDIGVKERMAGDVRGLKELMDGMESKLEILTRAAAKRVEAAGA